MIQGLFADILKDQRTRFNALFAEARHFYPLLDASVFAEHVTGTLNPIILAVAAVRPEAAQPTASALYELSLELVGREMLGRRSRYSAITAGWQRLLPLLALPLAESPTRTAGAITNALHNLATTPGARPMEWIDLLLRLAPQCLDVETFLRAGQVAAWRAGMAHYRLSALDLCLHMDPSQVAQLLSLPALPADFSAWVARLRADPWLTPAQALNPPARRSISLVAQVGGFRGYGGPFAVPPIVSGTEDTAFIIQEGAPKQPAYRLWRLYADCFGATLLQAEPLASSEMPPAISQLRLGAGGEVRTGMERQIFPQLIFASGSAENGSTLAVSTHFSHKISLLAQVARL